MIFSSKTNVIWSKELIKKFEYNWNWKELSANPSLPWSSELISEFMNKWEWEELSLNSSVPWSIELINNFEDNWNWDALSSNSSLVWSSELIEHLKSNLNWKILSSSSKLPWSLELIVQFNDFWHWEYLWCNESIYKYKSYKSDNIFGLLPLKSNGIFRDDKGDIIDNMWSQISSDKHINFDFVDKFKSQLNWGALAKNNNLNWSLEKVNYFASSLTELPFISSKPILDNSLIDEILSKASKTTISTIDYERFNCHQYHNVFSKITFGKYDGKTLFEIIRIDQSYISWCIINLEHFYINEITLNQIKILSPYFELSSTEKAILEEKLAKWNQEKSKINNFDDDYEKPQSYEDWASNEYGDEAGTAYWNMD